MGLDFRVFMSFMLFLIALLTRDWISWLCYEVASFWSLWLYWRNGLLGVWVLICSLMELASWSSPYKKNMNYSQYLSFYASLRYSFACGSLG